jgi:hypothetical protein
MPNMVQVNGQFSDSNGDPASGHILLVADGTAVVSGSAAFAAPVYEAELDDTGSFSLEVIATDNDTLGEIAYNVKIEVSDFPLTEVSQVAIPYSDGSGTPVGIFTLENAGWCPPAPADWNTE